MKLVPHDASSFLIVGYSSPALRLPNLRQKIITGLTDVAKHHPEHGDWLTNFAGEWSVEVRPASAEAQRVRSVQSYDALLVFKDPNDAFAFRLRCL